MPRRRRAAGSSLFLYAQQLFVSRNEPARSIVTAKAQEVNAHCGLDERRDVAPRAHGQNEVRHCDAENFDRSRIQTQTFYLSRLFPTLEHYVEVDLFRPAHGGDAEQLAYVEDAKATNLYVLAQKIGRAAHKLTRTRSSNFDDVVRDELVAAHDKV
jgi:hypothetical protein